MKSNGKKTLTMEDYLVEAFFVCLVSLQISSLAAVLHAVLHAESEQQKAAPNEFEKCAFVELFDTRNV